MSHETDRLAEAKSGGVPWRKWGPYLSERQWGTVREDYSDSGDAWSFLSHDAARSRAYKWGEDGMAGICDEQQILCFAIALWNERDPILKERMFGLTNGEGNHGEDVKEYYFYLDNTPTHSYMKYLYKYPQREYPYFDLVEGNRTRGRTDLEYELVDTGIFDDDRYFDVFVEYAKASPEDVLCEITVHNRGPDPAPLHVLPTLWFRKTWRAGEEARRPRLSVADSEPGTSVIEAYTEPLGTLYLAGSEAELLFTENDSNRLRFPEDGAETPYWKDAFHEYVVHKRTEAVNPARQGTKACARHRIEVPARAEVKLRLRLSAGLPSADALGDDFTRVLEQRRREADEFYDEVIPPDLSDDERLVYRQAEAGMLWSKQCYIYDVTRWIRERGLDPFSTTGRRAPRNADWQHLVQTDIISMPDKWEYPWYAAWDLAFHALPLQNVDPDFAKEQLLLLLGAKYLHPSGQLPAYEWNFGDVNPPVHAWSTYFLYERDKRLRGGRGDLDFLRRCFHKLVLNFTWWVNRKDPYGRNVFEGGFLGLDNIGVFDRSAPLPTGGHLEQADGTAWMAFFTQCMLQLSLELSVDDPTYEEMAVKFFEHFIWIASAMTHLTGDGMWDEEDGFFYDVLRLPDGRASRLRVRSMVGLLPLCASTVFTEDLHAVTPEVRRRERWFLDNRPELVASIHDPRRLGHRGRGLLAILDEGKLRRVLSKMLDENEFLSPYGIRSLSRYHLDHPYVYWLGDQALRVGYLPAESDTGMFGGNSNWRGPVWMPVNALIVRALLNLYQFYGDSFRVECPTGSGRLMNLYEVAREIAGRLAKIFLLDDRGRRPVFGGARKFKDDPLWRDHVLFYEYFHGDIGAGIGASHQTGWTGLIAMLLHVFAVVSPESLLAERPRPAAGQRPAPTDTLPHAPLPPTG